VRILTVDTQSPIPVYQQIVEHVRARVRDESLPPGTPLPSVRQLAADLGINPNTVAKAYLLLERDGAIATVRRRGTFVAAAARERVAELRDRRLDDAVDRLVRQAAELGLSDQQFLDAVRRRLDSRTEGNDKTEGSRS
jgi:GntR family transcriptional regulator